MKKKKIREKYKRKEGNEKRRRISCAGVWGFVHPNFIAKPPHPKHTHTHKKKSKNFFNQLVGTLTSIFLNFLVTDWS